MPSSSVTQAMKDAVVAAMRHEADAAVQVLARESMTAAAIFLSLRSRPDALSRYPLAPVSGGPIRATEETLAELAADGLVRPVARAKYPETPAWELV